LEESPAAAVVVEQFKDMLKEFCSIVHTADNEDEDMSGTARPSPALSAISHRSEAPVLSLNPPVEPPTPEVVPPTPAASTPVASVPAASLPPTPVTTAPPTPAATAPPTPVTTAAPTPVTTAPPTPVLTSIPAPSALMEVDEPEPELEAEEEPEAEEESGSEATAEPEETEEAEEEEEEEEGVELDPITIRGRSYWIDRASGKLYAVIDDDEVGDEVGEVKSGRVSFYTK
jgi:hypothetical protein